jgi:putative transposase
MGRVSKASKEMAFLYISEKEVAEIVDKRFVTLFAFCLMPNHFHILIKETVEGGIAKYMQRVLNSYTKYFNTKYEISGHLFQGPYKAVHLEDNDQLLYLSAYIHKNCNEISEWKNKYFKYPWSSLSDYVENNRWGKLLERDIICDQFKEQEEYKEFIKTSSAKEIEEEITPI